EIEEYAEDVVPPEPDYVEAQPAVAPAPRSAQPAAADPFARLDRAIRGDVRGSAEDYGEPPAFVRAERSQPTYREPSVAAPADEWAAQDSWKATPAGRHEQPLEDVPGYEDRNWRQAPAEAYEETGYGDRYEYGAEEIIEAADETDPTVYREGVLPPHSLDEERAVAVEPSSRKGLMVAAVVLALVVLGGGAALGYKLLFGSASDGPPPVIRADSEPTKVAPQDPGGAEIPHQNKLIYDRVGGNDANLAEERIVPREEPVVAVDDAGTKTTPRVVMPPTNATDTDAGTGPRRVRTVIVKPDGTIIGGDEPVAKETMPEPQMPAAAPAAETAAAASNDLAEPGKGGSTPKPRPGEPAAPAMAAPAAEAPAPAPVAAEPKVAKLPTPAVRPAAPAAPAPAATAPKEITPAAPTPAVAKAPAAAATTGGYVVQVSSQRTEEQARAAFAGLQRKFPAVLGNQQPDIRRADLGDRGVYYRVRVGPMGSRDDANALCGQLKAAGGDCLVQRN
ncbi:MAG TPA: SPOR domain-containing protein, partial [Hyphomicrobiales bacterium]|nr:SPOR domain-containing protein [Hyphomicrobiales bacterium]